MDKSKNQKCCDCGKLLDFNEFLKINPRLSLKRAQKLWDMTLISKYCIDCYLERPEKPYKNRSKRYSYLKFKK